MYNKNLDRSTIISSFEKASHTTGGVEMPLEIFMRNIMGNTWADHKLDMMNLQGNLVSQTEYKRTQLPYVTPSGIFSTRSSAGLIKHSGILALDLDNTDPVAAKASFQNDPYVFFAFTSISGNGLCVFIRIDGKKHAEAFEGAAEYFHSKYGLIVDTSCRDISHARFVSHDPNAYQNPFAEEFTKYIKIDKRKKQIKIADAIHLPADFENILKEIQERGIDITGGYIPWRNIGFALSDKFGEEGREAYHIVSKNSSTYLPTVCDKQYTACLRATGEGISINSFYHYAKLAGLSIMSERTRKIVTYAVNAKKSSTDQQGAVNGIVKNSGLEDGSDIAEIVAQVFTGNIHIEGESDFAALELYIKKEYVLWHNEVTDKLEIGDSRKEITDWEENSIYNAAKKVIDKTTKTDVGSILKSDSTAKYHPIKEFFARYADRRPTGIIEEMADCIEATNPPAYVRKFFKKWIVGMVANVFEDKSMSPLMMVLCGAQGDGKSYYWESFLPEELSSYATVKSFAALKTDTGKRDFDISSSRYWLIYDDEMSGTTTRDASKVKTVLQAPNSSVRAAYDKYEQKRKRIAAFGGTCNKKEVLTDETGNRRIFPIEVVKIDKNRKDKVNRIDLIIEAYHLYREGFDFRVLGEEIKELNSDTERFKVVTMEDELLAKYFRKAEGNEGEYLTNTDIKLRIENKHQSLRIDTKKLYASLKKMGLESENIHVSGVKGRYYRVVETGVPGVKEPEKPLPF